MHKLPFKKPLRALFPGLTPALVVGLVLLSMDRIGLAQEAELTIQLASGRVRKGFVDQRSTEETLWIRTQTRNSYLLRPVPWSQIVGVTQSDETLRKEDVLSQATPAPPDQPRPPATWPNLQPGFAPPNLPMPTPVSLSVRAEPGNWDQDAQLDGLVVWLRPQDACGELVPVIGQVEIECWGLERRHGKPGGELTLVERWSLPVGYQSKLTADGLRLELPFGAINPIERLDFNRWGLVKVRLSVPGSAVFEAELDGVNLKPATPGRDWQRISDLFPH